jgi:hypothetical protein
MAQSPAKTKVDELLSAIGQQAKPARPAPAKPPAAKAAKRPASEPAERPRATTADTATATGRFSSIYLNGEDQKILRELSVWFASQGRKINDTLIIRTALRSVHTGPDLLAAYDEATKSDRRFKKAKE